MKKKNGEVSNSEVYIIHIKFTKIVREQRKNNLSQASYNKYVNSIKHANYSCSSKALRNRKPSHSYII